MDNKLTYILQRFWTRVARLQKKQMRKLLFQYLITVCDDADKNCPTVWPGVNRRMHWSFQDPAAFEGTEEDKLAKFREVRDDRKENPGVAGRTIVMFIMDF